MKKFIFVFILLIILTLISGKSLKVKGSKLYDGNGKELLLRGINIAHAWFADKTQFSINEVSALGANSARIVLACGVTYPKSYYSEIKQIINWCESAGLVCVLELHDFTGSDNPSDITYTALNYWREMKDLVNQHKDSVIVNIANEWQGTWNKGNLWGDTYVSAVKSMRAYGIENVIMIDASGYGQETGPVIKDAKRVLNADPDRNIIFSYHVYSALGKDDNTLLNGFNGLKSTGVCWIAGEFGWWQNGGDVVYKTLMNYCKNNNIGWFAWSWSGNSGIDLCLDLTSPNSFSRKDLTTWGKYVFYGDGGIQSTSKKANISNSGSSSGSSSSSNTKTDNEYCKTCDVTATGDDGSQWGWENGKSCKIDSNKCNGSSSEISPNGIPYCKSCIVTSYGDDGSRWGWENEKSCLINDSRC